MDASVRRTPAVMARSVPLRPLPLRLLPLLSLTLLVGCHDYHWTADPQRAEQVAKAQHRYLFVFYKSWLSNDSNRMHGDVLPDPEVAANFDDTINLLIDSTCPDNVHYMNKYGVTSAPAFVLVAPDGDFQVRTGFLPKDSFIEFIQSARAAKPERRTPKRSAPRTP
jgi:hypothetical protein